MKGRLPSVRRADAEHERDPRKLTAKQIRCTRAVVRRWCELQATPGDEHRILVALGIEEDR